MNKKLLSAVACLGMLLAVVVFSGIADAAVPSGSSFVIIETADAYNTTSIVNFGESNQTALPQWTFNFYGNSTYSIYINGGLLRSGFTPSDMTPFSVPTTLSPGIYNVTVILNGVNYTAHNVHVVASYSSVNIANAYLFSTYPGQSQILAAYSGDSGELMYPYWNITLFSTQIEPYSVIVNGIQIKSGTIDGEVYVNDYINGSTASAAVVIGDKFFNFTDEAVSTVPLSKHYAPPAPPLLYGQAYLAVFQVKSILAAMFSLMVALLMVFIVMKKHKDTQVQES